MSKNLYLVPHDFTSVGDAALKYALHLGKNVHTEIMLLHVVQSSSELAKTSAKMDAIIANQTLPDGVSITKKILEGSIFEKIGSIAKKEAVQLIIMGTHGATGMQKLLGSNAMKVITSADTPFLIVQKDTPLNPITSVLVPIDLTKESLQIVNIAGDIASIFGAEVHVVGEKQNDELLSQQMKNRILIVKNQYEDRKIPCTVELLKSGGSYSKKILTYTNDNVVDMIAIAYHSESLLPQFDTFAQSLITNDKKIPCMVLNSKPASALYF